MKFFLLLAVIFLAQQLVYSQQQTCKLTEECGEKECCLIFNPFIMSKRLVSLINLNSNEGKCTPYRLVGETCTFGMNQCGCEPGSSCKKVSELPSVQGDSKMLIFMPPGVYECVKN